MRRLFFLLILSCICTGVLSQDGWSTQDYAYATSQTTFKAQRVIPPSPDAAELGKYGNLPVSFFTGTPQISIPLYEIKGSQLSLPLSLSYNASGFKPQDVASWVGLGWTLNAGGVITRSIMGNPDNSSNYFFANNNYQNPPLMTDLLPAYDYMDSITKASKETQPDMYYYNFGGYSGKFIMAPNQSIIRKEKNNLKFSSNGVPTDASASSWFQVVDENGNVYRFDKVEMSMMQQNDAVDQNLPVTLNYVYPSSWYLGSITSADGSEVISFTYYDNPSNQSQYSAYLQNQSYSYYHNPYSTSNTAYEGGNPVNYASPPYVTLSHRRYLQSISLTKGGNTIATVSLGLAANQRQDLDDLTYPGEQMPMNMTISSYKGLVKKYNFYYSYFTNSSSPSSPDYKRLRLDSVSEVPVDGSGLYKPPYSFVYDNSPMASQSQSSIDHWGFLNGGTVSTLVPYYTVNDQQYGGGANRNPSLSGSMTAMLTKINYPTGGSTALVYEGHQGFTDVSHTYFDVGGIRIKQMIDYSFPGKQAVVKNYSYVRPDGWGSGVSSIPSSYATFGTFHHYPEPVQGGCSLPQCTKASDYTFQLLTVSASSVAGLGSIAGSHIGYSYVTEYQTDTAGTMLGKTVYHYYTGFMGSKDDDIHSGDLLDKSVYDMFGKLLDKQENTYYLDNGDGALKVYTVTPLPNQDNYYELCKYTSGSNTVYQWKADWATNPVCVQSKLYKTKYIYSFYPIVSNWKQLTQEVHTTYDQLTNGYVVTTKKYTYGSTAHTMPTVIEQYSSSNDEIVTSKKYAGDYTVPGSGLDNASTGLQLLQTKNMLTKEIETVTYRQNQDGSGKRYIDGTLSFYGPYTPYLTSVKRLELSAPVTTLTASATNGTFTFDASYKPLASMKYDGSGNLIEQSKDQDMVTSYIWDYRSALPTAEVQNANATMIAYTGFESGSSGGNWSFNSSGITSGGRVGTGSFNLSSSYQVQATMPAGRTYTLSYWVHSGTATVTTNTGTAAGVSGPAYNGWTYVSHTLPAGSTQVTVASSAGANIDELRLVPKDALMSTYTYTPLVGTTSVSTPAEVLTTYQYDGFSRLVNVLDMSGNIVKNFKYNYGLGSALPPSTKTMFLSAAAQGTYTRQGCAAGTEPTSVTYYVPYGRYFSAKSQGAADTLALNDVIANGQSNANTNGLCLYWNVLQFAYYSKNDCTVEQGTSVCTGGNKPFNTKYTVAAHTYSSPVSQAAADQLALDEITANGQNYANSHCTCSCAAEGKKMINGVCQTGVRFNSSTTQMPNGTWQCVYYYQFSDGSVSSFYTVYGSSPCPIQ